MPATKTKQERLPHPRAARINAKLTWRGLAAAADVSQDTIRACESLGRYPKNRHIRAAYLKALGLKEVANV